MIGDVVTDRAEFDRRLLDDIKRRMEEKGFVIPPDLVVGLTEYRGGWRAVVGALKGKWWGRVIPIIDTDLYLDVDEWVYHVSKIVVRVIIEEYLREPLHRVGQDGDSVEGLADFLNDAGGSWWQ